MYLVVHDIKGKLKMLKQKSKSCNSQNYFPVFEQVIISTKNVEIELFFFPEKSDITIKKKKQ